MLPESHNQDRHGEALIIAVEQYQDQRLPSLRSPVKDAADLKSVLENVNVGPYAVTFLRNAGVAAILESIENHFAKRKKDDLLILYFAGHAIKDESGQLFFAATDTYVDKPLTTGVSASTVAEIGKRCLSRRQLFLLDCCFSGAFPSKMLARSVPGPVGTGEILQGKGRYVLTASDGLQYVFEGKGKATATKGSVDTNGAAFTRAIVTGLRTGDAAKEGEEFVTVDSLYDYIRDCVGESNPRQTPQKWSVGQEGNLIVGFCRFPGKRAKPTAASSRYSLATELRAALLERTIPTYTLDKNYYFVDWNTAFDELVAKPLELLRGQHALAMVRGLSNLADVATRSQDVFGEETPNPLVDAEVLEFESAQYGSMRFKKLAVQVPDEKGGTLGWTVALNVESVAKSEKMWGDVLSRIEDEVGWSKYAVSYDTLLLKFPTYLELVTQVVSLVGAARRCLDLGAGTGNGTLELLDTDPLRQVWAVEVNETMLQLMRKKLARRQTQRRYDGRLTLVKDDITRLMRVGQVEPFDAAVMMNVLYALDRPQAAIDNVFRVLKPGGVFALSTSHRNTDVERLFGRMKQFLQASGMFEAVQENYLSAKERHRAMDAKIHRDTKDDILNYLKSAGFKIEGRAELAYEDAVYVIKAKKPRSAKRL